jgi:hypothetical protein
MLAPKENEIRGLVCVVSTLVIHTFPFNQFKLNKALKVYSLSPEESSETRERLNVSMIMEMSRRMKRAYFRSVTVKHRTRSLILINSLKWGTDVYLNFATEVL